MSTALALAIVAFFGAIVGWKRFVARFMHKTAVRIDTYRTQRFARRLKRQIDAGEMSTDRLRSYVSVHLPRTWFPVAQKRLAGPMSGECSPDLHEAARKRAANIQRAVDTVR
jgi:hypothetical protein